MEDMVTFLFGSRHTVGHWVCVGVDVGVVTVRHPTPP